MTTQDAPNENQMAIMGQIVEMIVDRICFEVADPDATREEIMAQVNRVAATVSQGIFEALFGSTMASVLTVGKKRTAARIDRTNAMSEAFMTAAVQIVQTMTAAQIVAVANKVAALG